MSVNQNRMSYWYPIIERAVDPIWLPKTVFLKMDTKRMDLDGPLDILSSEEKFNDFTSELAMYAEAMGFRYPWWLRSDLISGKHCWPETRGRIDHFRDVGPAVSGILEHASNVMMFQEDGTDIWAIREYLPTTTSFHAFGGLPIVEEWRLIARSETDPDSARTKGFITDESGFYWPAKAIDDTFTVGGVKTTFSGTLRSIERLSQGGLPECLYRPTADAVSALGGDWSVDFMKTDVGWKLIDMALAAESWIPNPVGGEPPEAPQPDFEKYLVPSTVESKPTPERELSGDVVRVRPGPDFTSQSEPFRGNEP